MKVLAITTLMLTSAAIMGQNSILEMAEGYDYELSIAFDGDTIVHIPHIDLAGELQLKEPQRIIEDDRGTSRFYYWKGWRIAYHVHVGQRNGTTISRL